MVIDTVHRGVTPTPQEAWEIGKRYGASLVIYGDLLEPTSSDSGRVIMASVMGGMGNVFAGEYRSAGFRTMADDAVSRVLEANVWWFDRTLAERMAVQGQYSQALTVLQHAAPQESDQETTRRMLLAQFFAATGNNEAALREAMWCQEQGVTDAGIHAFLADLYLAW